MLADRIAKNSRHLRKWGRRQGFSCLRLYDHDIPQYPLALDDYEGHYLVTQSEELEGEALAEVRQALGADAEIVVKSRGRKAGGEGRQGQLDRTRAFLVQEQQMRFEINLHGYQDTGLFLDHRLTRAWVRSISQGRHVLNLFCYTGSFSVAAAVGGAARVTSVDLSRTYLDWAERNFQHNSLATPREWIRADILDWIQTPNSGQFDLIICDPPTFSNSKSMEVPFDVQAAHPSLIQRLKELLRCDGELLFSCNDRRFRMDPDLGLSEVTPRTRSEDFRRGGGHRSWHFKRSKDNS